MDKRALLLTRPRESSEGFVARLARELLEGVTLCFSPLIEIVPTGETADLVNVDGVIFTSAHGVRFGPEGAGRPAYCVGARTSEAAKAKKWNVILVEQTADDLVAVIGRGHQVGRLVHLAGTHRRGEIDIRLRQQGISVEVAALYDQVLIPLTMEAKNLLAGEVPVIVPLFSPRTAAQFVDQADQLNGSIIAAISSAVSEAVADRSVRDMYIATAPSAKEMTRLVEILLRKNSLS
jgi:uroporphyrinogen-III synthase